MIQKQTNRREIINYDGDQRTIFETSSYSVDYEKLFEWESARGGGLFLRWSSEYYGVEVREGFYNILAAFEENCGIMPKCINCRMFQHISMLIISKSEIDCDIYEDGDFVFFTETAFIAVMNELSSWWDREGHWEVVHILQGRK